jgi:flagella basal body P-ring formation protein FlgA
MNQTVLLDREELLVRDLVRGWDDGMEESFGRRIDISRKRLSLIPQRVVREAVAPRSSFVLIGGRTAVIPLALYGDIPPGFLAELLFFLDEQDPQKDGRLEVEVQNPFMLPESFRKDSPRFILLAAQRKMGYLSGDVELAYRYDGGEKDEKGEAPWDNGGVLKLTVHQHVPTAYVTRAVEKNQPLLPEVLGYRERELSSAAAEFVLPDMMDSAKRYVANRPLKEGAFIETGFLEETGGVEPGDQIRISFIRGNIRMEVLGRALRGGAVGDTVPVRSDSLPRGFEGKVVGPKEVVVELP